MSTTAISTTTIDDVAAFIAGYATDADLERIFTAARARSRELARTRAAEIEAGQQVRLVNLSPKYLNGLTGEVGSIDNPGATVVRATVILDEASTERLRVSGRRRFFIPNTTTRYGVEGVPVSSCERV